MSEWLSSPVLGGRITARFGESGPMWTGTHTGTDFDQISGITVWAVAPGTVSQAGWFSNAYGNMVTIDHGNGIKTRYAHLSSISVSVGDVVAKRGGIGRVGATGNVTGSHVHLEVMVNGQLRNPEDYLGNTIDDDGGSSPPSNGGPSVDTGELESGAKRIGMFAGGLVLLGLAAYGLIKAGVL